MQNYVDPTALMVQALANRPQGTQVAGDVIPLPMTPASGTNPLEHLSHTGNTNMSAPYATGKAQDPQIIPMPMGTLNDWMQRSANRNR